MAPESRFLALPTELRDQVYTAIALSVQPFEIQRDALGNKHGSLIASSAGSGLLQTCRQAYFEYTRILNELVPSPDAKIATAVYDFDFSHLKAFVRTLDEQQIALVNRHRSITAHLFVVNIDKEEADNMANWLKVCDETGVDVEYVLQWSGFTLTDFCTLERILAGHLEGPKIWKAVGAPTVS